MVETSIIYDLFHVFDGDMLCAIHYSRGLHSYPVEVAWLTTTLTILGGTQIAWMGTNLIETLGVIIRGSKNSTPRRLPILLSLFLSSKRICCVMCLLSIPPSLFRPCSDVCVGDSCPIPSHYGDCHVLDYRLGRDNMWLNMWLFWRLFRLRNSRQNIKSFQVWSSSYHFTVTTIEL